MNLEIIASLALFILLFGFISKRIQTTAITSTMVFVLFGILVSKQALGIFHSDLDSSVIHIIAELTLILILFTDASRIDLKEVIREHAIPIRLLGIGLPLTIIFGAILASVVFNYLTFWEGALLAAILAPTDAALGQAVVSNPRVPVRIRQSLNIESGLNDGIALPLILILISIAGIEDNDKTASYWIKFSAFQIILGPLAGICIGYVGGKMVEWSSKKDWMSREFQDISVLGLSLLAFSVAELIGGNGFIAAFTAGLTLGNTSKSVCSCLYEFGEAEGQLLTLITFMIFGAFMVLPELSNLNWQIVLYGVLSLTIIRMIPVAISLIGLRLKFPTIFFIGWFGPRGIASILFALLILEESGITNGNEIFAVIMITVLFSIFAHGITSVPLSAWYAKKLEELKHSKEEIPEHAKVTEMPTRIKWKD